MMTIALLAGGFLASRLARGWLAIPLVLASAPVVFTLIGAFDDGESWMLRAAFGFILAIQVAVGLLLGHLLDRRPPGTALTARSQIEH